jgi:hypothetical protein
MGIVSEVKKKIKRLILPVRWHDLRHTKPVSEVFGLDRGMAIDRYYIEKFLEENAHSIKGTVLEIAESTYSKKFGRRDTVRFEVLHYSQDHPDATIVGDLTQTATLPEKTIDCFICTQTFNFIYDFRKAIAGSYHLLKENGILLATVGGISQISRFDMDRWGDYWRFTTKSACRAFEEVFGEGNVVVESYGNVLTAVAFLEGISARELKTEELDHKDDNYQLLITIRAVKKQE